MALGWVLTVCCYNSLSLSIDAMPRHKHHNVRMSICGYCMFLIDSTQCSSFLPLTSWLLESKRNLISLLCFGIFKGHKMIQAAEFICQFHLLYVWDVFKSRSIKRTSQRDIKELKLLSFALYQHFDGNKVQIPVFLETIHICIKKEFYNINRNTTNVIEITKGLVNFRLISLEWVRKVRVSLKNRKEKGRRARCGRGR